MSLSPLAVFAPRHVVCSDGLDPQLVCLVGQQPDCAAFGERGGIGQLVSRFG